MKWPYLRFEPPNQARGDVVDVGGIVGMTVGSEGEGVGEKLGDLVGATYL
jgi:hypothetical protein